MNRCEWANARHNEGFNCCQCVLSAFGDVTGLENGHAMALSVAMGRGANTGELCGALSGAVLALGCAMGVDMSDPVGSKRRAGEQAAELQRRFAERFGALRCEELLRAQEHIDPPAGSEAERLGITSRCAVYITAAVELTEEMLKEQGRI